MWWRDSYQWESQASLFAWNTYAGIKYINTLDQIIKMEKYIRIEYIEIHNLISKETRSEGYEVKGEKIPDRNTSLPFTCFGVIYLILK